MEGSLNVDDRGPGSWDNLMPDGIAAYSYNRYKVSVDALLKAAVELELFLSHKCWNNLLDEDDYYKEGKELNEEVVRGVFVQNLNLLTKLEHIDNIGKLGLTSLIEYEIKEALKEIETLKDHDSIKDDLHITVLCFRLLRQRDFNVSQVAAKPCEVN